MKAKFKSLVLIFGDFDPLTLTPADCFLGDHILRILKSDLVAHRQPDCGRMKGIDTTGLESLLDRFTSLHLFDDVAVVGKNGSSKDLSSILDHLEKHLADDTMLRVTGFRLDTRLWEIISDRFTDLSLNQCHLAPSEWKQTSGDRRCTSIFLYSCSGPSTHHPLTGKSGWPSLKTLLVNEDNECTEVSPRPESLRIPKPSVPSSNELTQAIVTRLWRPELEEIHLHGCTSLAWVETLPIPKALSHLGFDQSPLTLGVFDWILANKHVRWLGLSWDSEIKIPWRSLRSLRRLKALDAEDTHLDDAQLAEIARNAKLSYISFYYSSKITAASWKTLLTWPSLRQVWASQELMTGPIPEDLPATTNLKEAVALNAKTDQFRALLSRYPSVKVVQM